MGELDNKKVKINVDKIIDRISDKEYYNLNYLDFIEINKDKVFTAIREGKYATLYTFQEDATWLFFEDDLILVEG